MRTATARLLALTSAIWLVTTLPVGASIGVECGGARPGSVLVVPLTPPLDPRPYPTFGFMFGGSDGHLYASTAGHVVLGLDAGERVWPDGSGVVASDIEHNRVGEFVYAINTRPEVGPDLPPGADLALIRVDGQGEIGAAVCDLGGPQGIDDRIEASSALVAHRWFGATVFGGRVGYPAPVEGPWVVPARSGISIGMPSAYSVTVNGHTFVGDSGAPVLSEGGLAVGWVSGPPRNAEELSRPGSFVVSRIGPAIERAEEALGIALTLATG